MQKIIPHLWFDQEAAEAAHWYVDLFENSSIEHVVTIPDTPSGDAELVSFKLENLEFAAISAGPYFSFDPAVSFMVSCSSREEVDRLYTALKSEELMPLGEYPFSKRYAWIQDKYGLNWQLMLVEHSDIQQKIRPSLLFTGAVCGRAEEALDYYRTVFPASHRGVINRYAAGEADDPRAKTNYAEAVIGGLQLVAMDNGYNADFTFSEAISFLVRCASQQEIDEYWDKLSFVPEAEQCGWLKDRFGFSWQIVPEHMDDVYSNGTKDEIKRVTQAFLQMKKLDIAAIERARQGLAGLDML